MKSRAWKASHIHNSPRTIQLHISRSLSTLWSAPNSRSGNENCYTQSLPVSDFNGTRRRIIDISQLSPSAVAIIIPCRVFCPFPRTMAVFRAMPFRWQNFVTPSCKVWCCSLIRDPHHVWFARKLSSLWTCSGSFYEGKRWGTSARTARHRLVKRWRVVNL